MKIIKIINEINRISPIGLQLDYDNSGLQVGDLSRPLKNILTTLDVSLDTIDRAKKAGANLIISHHPVIFRALKRIDGSDNTGKKLISAIKSDIAIYSCHTNFDSVKGGLNDHLAQLFGLTDLKPLMPRESSSVCKLVVFVPKDDAEKLKDALYSIGAGTIGDYTGCSFSAAGDGTFTAPASSKPYIGEPGRSNRVEEVRVELIITRPLLSKAIAVIMKVHPYEEPAFDIYPLIYPDTDDGIGRIGRLSAGVSASDMIELVKRKLKVKDVRFIGSLKRKVQRVAVCSGSGGSLIGAAVAKGADLYITGDIKYHEARIAEEAGLSVIDAGHHATEEIFAGIMKSRLGGILKKCVTGTKVITYKAKDPFKIL